MDNIRKTINLLKETGQQDIEYFKSTHQEMVDAIRKNNVSTENDTASTFDTLYPEDVTVVDDDDIFDN